MKQTIAELQKENNRLLNLLADIREAIGDPTGKLMQDELVKRCKELRDSALKADMARACLESWKAEEGADAARMNWLIENCHININPTSQSASIFKGLIPPTRSVQSLVRGEIDEMIKHSNWMEGIEK